MAQYDVDILLKIAGQQELKNLQTKLGAAEKAAEGLNKNLRALNKFDASGATKRVNIEQKLLNITRERLKLQRQFVESTSEGNRKARQAAADFIRRQRIYRQGMAQYAGPIGPGAASPLPESSPVALSTQLRGRLNRQLKEAADLQAHLGRMEQRSLETNKRLLNNQKLQKKELGKIVDEKVKGIQADKKAADQAARDARKRSLFGDATAQQRAGAAVSAGAFPLLFGGGPGMALGGALGGAVTGKTFGPAAIALQVLGGFFDELAAKAATLGQALNLATADIDAVVESLGVVGSPTQDAIQSLEELAGEQAALQEATRQLSLVVGDEGVEALMAFGDASTRFGNALTQITTQILAQIARLTGPVVKEIATSMEISALLSAAKASKDPRQVALQEKLAAQSVQAGTKGMPAMERVNIETKMVELQKKIRQEEEERLAAKVEAARVGSAEHVIAKNDLKITQLNGDLTSDRIFNLEKANIFQEARAKAQKEGADLALIELERTRQLKELENKRADLITRANEKNARLSDREERKKQRAIERATKAVEREMERTDEAFDKASRQLDDITNKHEDKMAFEREYSRLIQEGSTPAAAKQAVELQKQLLELDRVYDKQLKGLDAQILKTENTILELKALGGITTEYEKQLDLLKKRKEEIEGKKGKAKGAITKDLAPETGRDRIEAEMERIQGALNELIDPANQVILAAEAIGDAFSESFKGLITGSMSAQEALANLFQRTADHFLDMAAQMIAAQIKMKILGIGLNLLSGGLGGGASSVPSSAYGDFSVAGPSFFQGGMIPGFAEGGYVSGPTTALVGEGGQGEYIIPENRMRESMSRYSRGARGAAVVPETGSSGTSGEGGGTAVAAPIDVRFNVERINNVDYVTAEEFQAGMKQAASQGAQRGQQLALTRLQQSPATRRRLGL